MLTMRIFREIQRFRTPETEESDETLGTKKDAVIIRKQPKRFTSVIKMIRSRFDEVTTDLSNGSQCRKC